MDTDFRALERALFAGELEGEELEAAARVFRRAGRGELERDALLPTGKLDVYDEPAGPRESIIRATERAMAEIANRVRGEQERQLIQMLFREPEPFPRVFRWDDERRDRDRLAEEQARRLRLLRMQVAWNTPMAVIDVRRGIAGAGDPS